MGIESGRISCSLIIRKCRHSFYGKEYRVIPYAPVPTT